MDIKKLLEEKFNISVNSIKEAGVGYDCKAYLVNDEYIFKIKNGLGFAKEKAIYDFLNKNLNSNIKVPNIEYSIISDDLSILGYKVIEGKFLTPDLYNGMSEDEQLLLKTDIATFLRQMHDLDYSEISEYTIDNKQNVLEEYELLRSTVYDNLNDIEKDYIESFMERLNTTDIFDDRKCLCHNDFSCDHILIDDENRFCGVLDFGDSGIIDEYCDFIYLLDDSEAEMGSSFGEEILKLYGNINIEKAKEYHDVVRTYYPIEIIIYGIKNNNREYIDKGRREIYDSIMDDAKKEW